MEAVGIPCRNKCVCYKMSANYRKRPIFSVMDNGQLWKLLQNENTIAIVQKQKSGNFFELLWFKKVSGFSVMLFEEPFCNRQSHFYEKRSIFQSAMVAAKRDNIQTYYSAKARHTPRIYYRGWISRALNNLTMNILCDMENFICAFTSNWLATQNTLQ